MSDAVSAGRRVPKPWGFEIVWAETERYVGKMLHIERGHALSLQYHERKDETIYLISGLLDLEFGGPEQPLRTVRLHPGDTFRVRPLLRHRMTAVETCELVEASTPELDDVVRLEDRYGRAGTTSP